MPLSPYEQGEYTIKRGMIRMELDQMIEAQKTKLNKEMEIFLETLQK